MPLNKQSSDVQNARIYEDPCDYGILKRFEDAVEVLSTETGSLNRRLCCAYFDCGIIHLSSNNFNDKFIQDKLSMIEHAIEKGTEDIRKAKMPSDYYQEVRTLKLHWKKSSEMANCIFQIYKYLTNLRASKGFID